MNELELPKTCKTEFPDPDDLLNFKLKIFPDEGFYKHGQGREPTVYNKKCNKLYRVVNM